MKYLQLVLNIGLLVGVIEAQQKMLNAADPQYFDAILDRVEQLFTNLSFIDMSDLKVRRVEKTRLLFGTIKLYRTFDNNISTLANAYGKQGGEYRLLPYRLEKKPFCQFFSEDEYFYEDLAMNSDFPADIKNNCPIQAGDIVFRGVLFKLDNLPRATVNTGEYALEMVHMVEEVEISKFRFYLTIVKV